MVAESNCISDISAVLSGFKRRWDRWYTRYAFVLRSLLEVQIVLLLVMVSVEVYLRTQVLHGWLKPDFIDFRSCSNHSLPCIEFPFQEQLFSEKILEKHSSVITLTSIVAIFNKRWFWPYFIDGTCLSSLVASVLFNWELWKFYSIWGNGRRWLYNINFDYLLYSFSKATA